MKQEAILLTDGYKLDHRRQYPEGTEKDWTLEEIRRNVDASIEFSKTREE